MKAAMNENDPRVIRTRHLLLDAFIVLVRKKDFTSISVKDIAEYAQVNRATFYAHFQDKYDILEYMVIDKFMNLLSKRIDVEATLNEEALRNIILFVCEYVETVSNSCKRNYAAILSLMEEKIKLKLYDVIYDILKKENAANHKQDEQPALIATMISSSIYAAASKWNRDGRVMTVEALTEGIMDFIAPGITIYKN
ncbi:MAG TPA: TetR/AcrR family transcriptional regulator [Anaerovoracaceae bacterium]|nr:TetR/AcrR family transcriptional regulator [Anaerovoracaceae bacterium]